MITVLRKLGFLSVTGAALVAPFVVSPTLGLGAIAVGVYILYAFAVTAGYHRYFAHRTYKTSRPAQFALAWLSQSTLQKGVLWWAAHHRDHHKYADEPGDPHSPVQRGFWYAHMGWIMDDTADNDLSRVQDLARFPELRWLNRWFLVPPLVFAGAMWLIGGWPLVVWGSLIPTVVLMQCTYSINSLAHMWGTRPYDTTDASRNNLLLALLTMGEGWHNNHHFYQTSARQGFRWYQVDATWYILKVLSWLGIVWDLKEPPAKVLAMDGTMKARRVSDAPEGPQPPERDSHYEPVAPCQQREAYRGF